MRAKLSIDRNIRLAEILDQLAMRFPGRVRRSEVADALGRFSYGALIAGDFALSVAADEARVFVERSSAAGKALARIVTELRKEVKEPARTDSGTIPEMPDPRVRVEGAIRGADPGYSRDGSSRFREFPKKIRRDDFKGAADGEKLIVATLVPGSGHATATMDFLMWMDGRGLLAVGRDARREGTLIAAILGDEAFEKIRSSGLFRVRREARFKSIKRRPKEKTKKAEPGAEDTPREMAENPAEEAKKASIRSMVKYPIGFKLILIITLLITSALSGMIFLASYFFREDARVRIEENNHQSAQVLGLKEGDYFLGIVTKTRFLLSLRDSGVIRGSGDKSDGLIRDFFDANPEILYAGVMGNFEFVNEAKVAEWELDEAIFDRIRATEADRLDAGTESPIVANLTPYFDRSATLIAVPYRESDEVRALAIIVDVSSQVAALRSRSIGYSFVVNGEGDLILHPDESELSAEKSMASLPVVDLALRSLTDNGQTLYSDEKGVVYLGAFRKTDFAALSVVTVTPAALAFEAADRIQRRNLYIMGAVLSLAILLTYFYSRTITRPVGVLMGAANKIENGDFQLSIVAKTRDELGALTASFVAMSTGLGEREKIKEAFGKFVNKDIAERAMRNELSLGGERRVAAVFFSDVRSFTAISESLEPEEVVEFLNEYFTIMVACVEKTGGVVDKFIGDAIMAVWGVPVSSGRDSAAAVDAALLMRSALEDFNKPRGTPRKPKIRIGCAINTGPVLSGQIGSARRMEYTVIGDTVNLASRLEALTKPFAVDILVSQAVHQELGEEYRFETMPLVTVKGKNEPQHVFAVLGKSDDDKSPRSLRELRERLGIAEVALDTESVVEGEEQKYHIEERSAQ